MPTYQYQCSQCFHSLDAFQKISDLPMKLCPECGHETLRRGPGGGIGVQFGPGFFKNGYDSARTIETTPPRNDQAVSCCPCGKGPKSCNNK
jgi:putative FmdB family regulatory protein